ncbi:hypothetical protein QLQ12_27750 [Actinoplanes sp. NEAU-A12]|uniref:Lipoprotein n=1 Tax=Actinoplanes sandaracinus TaxID=3045177 RepID=A0ABT6WRU3_9ACTN|nr:hypothetical protein [Actinoplanes sandaracinus]MDI6102419.1 hypothetical protein [Actinoplanes sandaracinus]
MKRFLAGAVAGATVLALSAGCANQIQQLEPKLELKKAAEDLGAASRTGFTIKAGGSVDDLIALAKKEAGTGKDAFTDSDADILRKLYNSSFTAAWDKAGEGVADDKGLFNATIDGVTGLEVRVVDQVTYVKVPVKELATKFGATTAEIDEISGELGSQMPGLDKLVEGGWVSVAAADLEKITKEAGVPVSPPGQEDNDKIVAELKTSAENLLQGADVARDAQDQTHLVVTTTTVKAHTEAKRFLEAAKKIIAKEQSTILDEATGDVLGEAPADKPIVLDLWIDNGKFKAFEMNLLQFVEGNTGRASIRVEIGAGADITAPAGATKLDLTPFLAALGAAGRGTGSGSGGGEAKTWAEMVGQQTVRIAETQGGKPATHLKKVADEMALPGVTVKVVRSGVAQVTAGSSVACVTVPATASGEPKVAAGAC